MKPYRIIVADDHSLIRQGLKTLIAQEPTLELVAEAANGIELLALLRIHGTDMVILDITMPQLNGLEAMAEIRKINPEFRKRRECSDFFRNRGNERRLRSPHFFKRKRCRSLVFGRDQIRNRFGLR